MMNTTPAIRVILGDIKEEVDKILDEDDVYFSDDDFEEMLPKLAARILGYEDPAKTLVVVAGILLQFLENNPGFIR